MSIIKMPPVREARNIAKRIVTSCKSIESIILDQWRVNEEKDQWRLSYGGDYIANCPNRPGLQVVLLPCEECPVYIAAGGKDQKDIPQIRTTLVPAETKDLITYPGGQFYLNCKSIDQYIEAFVKCFIGEMNTYSEMLKELDYVVNLRLVYFKGKNSLKTTEKEIKAKIIESCLGKYDETRKKEFERALVGVKLL